MPKVESFNFHGRFHRLQASARANLVLEMICIGFFYILSSHAKVHRIRFYDLTDFTLSRWKQLEEYERMMNFTFNVPIKQNQIYQTKSVETEGGNKIDLDGPVSQRAIFQHFIGANIAFKGVNQKGKFYMPVYAHLATQASYCFDCRSYYQFNGEPSRYHSLISFRKVVVAFSYHLEFGHFLNDLMCGLVLTPSDILEDAEIFIRYRNVNTIKSYCELLGFDPNHFHKLPNDWIYCNELFICESAAGLSSLHVSWRDLNRHIYRVNKFDEIPAVNHIFINKQKTEWGCVLNEEEIYEYAKKEYPQYNWMILEPKAALKTMEFAKTLASAKILLSASGSLAFNDLFLRPQSGVYLMASNHRDNPAFLTAFSLDLYLLACGTDNIQFGFNYTGGKFPISQFKETFPLLLSAVYNHSWPDNLDQLANRYYDYTELYKKYKKFYGNYTTIYKLKRNSITSVHPWHKKLTKFKF